ncbi:hypothetical protein NDU88_005578 [Pleurodeles waltl]|uniref:Uncharacterized protein n=1 Tax=Pleurodeles waltl TaxID=8319 RepID=A0AAV7WY97_PLEWA|nr:hypothetical protein NDU88_005578 [Pleurodeles waltl]
MHMRIRLLERQQTHIDKAECQISDIENTADQQGKSLKNLKVDLETMKAINEDLGARSHRSNLRIIEISKSVNMRCAYDYAESMLIGIFCHDSLSSMFTVERAQALLAPKFVPGAPPCPITVKLLHYKDTHYPEYGKRQNTTPT